jgi:3'-5' exoribonuclease 1
MLALNSRRPSVFEKVAEASREVHKECNKELFEPEDEKEYILPVEPYEEAPRKDNSRVAYVMQNLQNMSLADMKRELQAVHLDSNGTKKVLRKRLKQYFRKEYVLMKSSGPEKNRTVYYDYFIVIDFECTCEDNIFEYEHEIIEFPAILVDVRQKVVIDHFSTYVRPVINPTLSPFCTKLTGITQEMVDRAPYFPDALRLFRRWMESHKLNPAIRHGCPGSFAFVTDGPWDLAKFFQMQCLQVGMTTVPHEFRYFVNVRKAFINRYCRGRPLHKVSLASMLTELEMQFQGREHCGLDDSLNIARIVIRMLQDRAELRVNEKLVHGKHLLGWQKQSGVSDAWKDDERQKWRDSLPYKMVQISRERFLAQEYRDCESCSSDEEDTA